MRHPSFLPEQWITANGDHIQDEQGYNIHPNEFWRFRMSEFWDSGWEIVEDGRQLGDTVYCICDCVVGEITYGFGEKSRVTDEMLQLPKDVFSLFFSTKHPALYERECYNATITVPIFSICKDGAEATAQVILNDINLWDNGVTLLGIEKG